MKKIIFILSIVAFVSLRAQLKNSYSASGYYTYGSYSNSDYSNSFKLDGSVGIKSLNYLKVNYDEVKIEDSAWLYDQSGISISYLQNYYPFYFHASYMRVSGKYTSKDTQLFSNDTINIYSVKAKYNFGLNYISLGINYKMFSGFSSFEGICYKLEFTRLFGLYLKLKSEILYSRFSDGRNFTSVGMNANYEFGENINIFADISVGEKLYYYDEEALVLYNQIDVQKSSYGIGAFYSYSAYAGFFLKYTRLEFNSYDINYATIGISTEF